MFSESRLEFKGVTEVGGRTYEIDFCGSQAHVFPAFHPAAALYNARQRTDLERDLEAVKRTRKVSDDSVSGAEFDSDFSALVCVELDMAFSFWSCRSHTPKLKV